MLERGERSRDSVRESVPETDSTTLQPPFHRILHHTHLFEHLQLLYNAQAKNMSAGYILELIEAGPLERRTEDNRAVEETEERG